MKECYKVRMLEQMPGYNGSFTPTRRYCKNNCQSMFKQCPYHRQFKHQDTGSV